MSMRTLLLGATQKRNEREKNKDDKYKKKKKIKNLVRSYVPERENRDPVNLRIENESQHK
jgi:hypothetical protein